MRLTERSDRVVGANRVRESEYVWNITNDGVAKTSPAEQYLTRGRGGNGLLSMRLSPQSREVVAATVGMLEESIIVLTSKSQARIMNLDLAITMKRGHAGGNPVIALRDSEEVVAVVEYQARIDLPAFENDGSEAEFAEIDIEMEPLQAVDTVLDGNENDSTARQDAT